MYISDTHLKSFLADAGLVRQKDFDAAGAGGEGEREIGGRHPHGAKFDREDELRRTYAYILGIPFVSLVGTVINYETLGLIPEPVARRNNIIAYNHRGDELEVAMLDTDDFAAIDFIKKKTRLKILPRLTDVASIKSALKQYQQGLKDNLGDVIQRETEALEKERERKKRKRTCARWRKASRRCASSTRSCGTRMRRERPTSTSSLWKGRFSYATASTASCTTRWSCRSMRPPPSRRVSKCLANMRLDEHRLPQDGRFGAETGGEKISFRVSILPTYYGEKIVMRLLRDSISGFTLESIGFHGARLGAHALGDAQDDRHDLSCGPTGAGKSTTLYTLLDLVNTPNVNISTIEDPIEYQMERINQTQVRPEIGFTFANGLRSLVRQDPDIVMVGEIRDKETASFAINAALTGHLVLSTLHTNSAAGAIPRLLDMGVEPFSSRFHAARHASASAWCANLPCRQRNTSSRAMSRRNSRRSLMRVPY